MICFVKILRNNFGEILYVGCPKVVLGSKAIDWEVDGLSPRLKHRVQKSLSSLKKYLGLA